LCFDLSLDWCNFLFDSTFFIAFLVGVLFVSFKFALCCLDLSYMWLRFIIQFFVKESYFLIVYLAQTTIDRCSLHSSLFFSILKGLFSDLNLIILFQSFILSQYLLTEAQYTISKCPKCLYQVQNIFYKKTQRSLQLFCQQFYFLFLIFQG